MGDAILEKIIKTTNPGYEYFSELGGGEYSKIVLLRDKISGKKIVLKIVDSDQIKKGLEKEHGSVIVYEKFEKIKLRFDKEAKIQEGFDHPNIVKIQKSGIIKVKGDEIPYILMEYIDGMSLRELLHNEKPLGFPRVMEISGDILSALSYVHDNGVIHRDLNAANIMIKNNGNGESSLIDFGLSKKIIDDSKLTTTGAARGTLYYMAPEHFLDGSGLGIETDIYAFGVILFKMLTGKVPFNGGRIEIMKGHIYQPIPYVKEIIPNLPIGIQEIIEKAMAKEMAGRYNSAREMLTDLKKIKYDPDNHNNNPVQVENPGSSTENDETVKLYNPNDPGGDK